MTFILVIIVMVSGGASGMDGPDISAIIGHICALAGIIVAAVPSGGRSNGHVGA